MVAVLVVRQEFGWKGGSEGVTTWLKQDLDI